MVLTKLILKNKKNLIIQKPKNDEQNYPKITREKES